MSGNTTLNCDPLVDRWVAASLTASGDFTLTQIDLALGYLSGTNGVAIDLVNGVGRLPGTTTL